MIDTVYAVFYRRKDSNDGWEILPTRRRGKTPYYGERHTAQSLATWRTNNTAYSGPDGRNYEFTVMKLRGNWTFA